MVLILYAYGIFDFLKRAELEEIRSLKDEADRLGAKTEFTLLAEASEYRESERIRAHLAP